MNHQGFAVTKIGQVVDHIQIVDKVKAGLLVLQTKRQHAAETLAAKEFQTILIRGVLF